MTGIREVIEDHIIPAIKKIFSEAGELPPAAFILSKGADGNNMLSFVGLDTSTQESKQASVILIKETAAELKAIGVVVVFEAWTAFMDADGSEDLTTPPSERSDRQESIMVLYEGEADQQGMIMIPIFRLSDTATLGEPVHTECSGSTELVGLFTGLMGHGSQNPNKGGGPTTIH